MRSPSLVKPRLRVMTVTPLMFSAEDPFEERESDDAEVRPLI
jgi:hypothetical protein